MDTYKTKDIFEAAWLHSQGISFLNLEPDNRYFWFVFENFEQATFISQEYWSQNARGNIKEFVNSLKTLKDLVFSKK